MCIPEAPSYGNAPQKTDADIAKKAEEERRRLGLSQNGFGKNFSPAGYGTPGAGYENPPLKRIVLGA